MNTSLFSNMFKSLFGEQITPTSGQFVPITASDGTPAGISSIANLQSVLGSVTGPGIVSWPGGEPFIGSSHGRIKIYNDNHSSNFVEIAIQCENLSNVPTPVMKIRSTYNGVTSEWKTVTTT